MPKKSIIALATGLIIAISGCGMRGGLVMPPGPAPEPILGHPKPMPQNKTGTNVPPAQAN